ncbi:endo-1,4-beta-xylanase 1-like [Lolium rigidum]|uniref:endo-1,4-beta-xylanase 1-like n=1 Tax=Lolium rigidum TaxID=89674 RepID=UPI001F5CA54C|nr:endo-1,4-beta-xylanase 1-like [Lolium rigidum]
MSQEVAFDVNMVQNSTLDDGGLAGWAPFGSRTTTLSVHREDDDATLEITMQDQHEHDTVNKPSGRYILVSGRADEKDGLRQAITGALKPRVTYRVAGWVSLGASSPANAAVCVNLAVDRDEGLVECGAVSAEAGRWTEVKGAFRLRTEPSRAAVYVHGAPAGVDVKVMDLRVFATDRKARFRLLKDKTDKARKRDVVLKFGEAASRTPGGASVRVVQIDNTFPFGTCINTSVIQNPAFMDFFTNHFDWAVFENELKWYHTENQQGQLNYADADSLLDFCDRHGVRVRGHCIFWSVEGDVQQWVKNLQGRDQLMSAVQARLHGLVSRYAGKFQHYDVNNEMLHGHFFRDRLGDDVPALMFTEAAKIDPAAALFVNDYNVECANDPNATPEKYIELIKSLQRGGADVRGIGLQGHVSNPVGQVICDALDKLATTGIPIWFTELDVPEQDVSLRAQDLEVVLREAYAHPAVQGVVFWGFLQGTMWRQNAWLVNADGTVNEAGQMFVNLQKEWKTDARGNLDDDGNFKFRGFHGTYFVEVKTATGKQILKTFTVDKGDNNNTTPLVLNLADA